MHSLAALKLIKSIEDTRQQRINEEATAEAAKAKWSRRRAELPEPVLTPPGDVLGVAPLPAVEHVSVAEYLKRIQRQGWHR